MEALAALGLASNIIQIVDFGARLLSKSREIHHSADGSLDENNILEDVTSNLAELSFELSIHLRQEQSRKRHEDNHTIPARFECYRCGRKFKRKDVCLKHVKRGTCIPL